jgi:hypothetical protein
MPGRQTNELGAQTHSSMPRFDDVQMHVCLGAKLDLVGRAETDKLVIEFPHDAVL